MKVIKRVLNISFCFCILAGCLASCSQDEESVTNVSRTETEGINKDAILAFPVRTTLYKQSIVENHQHVR